MLSRLYLIFGCLVLTGYAVSAYEGWEFGNPTRQRVPAAGGRSSGGWFGSSSGGSGSSSTRSGWGGGGGGK